MVEWNAEIINEIPNKLIAWQSIEGSDVVSAGSVNFDDVGAGAGTRVQRPPAVQPARRQGRRGAREAARARCGDGDPRRSPSVQGQVEGSLGNFVSSLQPSWAGSVGSDSFRSGSGPGCGIRSEVRLRLSGSRSRIAIKRGQISLFTTAALSVSTVAADGAHFDAALAAAFAAIAVGARSGPAEC